MEAKSTSRDPDFTRKQLKIAARREFNSVGYFSTDTNKIAKLAGYAPGSFYRHFKDKVDIFIEIYQDWHLEQMLEIERALFAGGSIEEMSDRLATIVINFYGNWKPLRAAARVLVISEERVAEFKTSRRTAVMQNIIALRTHLNLITLPEEKIILFLILIERLGDAVSDGEFDLPSLPKNSGHHALVEMIGNFLQGGADS